jgi:hypothetical protein
LLPVNGSAFYDSEPVNEIKLKINRLLESQAAPGRFPAIFVRGGAMTIGVTDKAYITALPAEYTEGGFISLLDEPLHKDFFRVVIINLDSEWLAVCNCRKTQ